MFERILIANRGEITCRIIETCRRLGVETVAVYSDADRSARHVRLADTALPIGPAPAQESYLCGEKIISAALSSGAEAIHPGYGFLAENQSFARDCGDAGLVFVGPRPDTIEKMGSKSEAKKIMEAAGVPVVPGYHGEDQDPTRLAERASEIGYPLMIKAVAGGGGKGMRTVNDPNGFQDALDGAKREAMNAFGNDAVLLERRLRNPRHIEFQVFGDTQGHHVQLFERECSIQRRHQKIIEETPSPFVDYTLRARMAEAAVSAARAVDYMNAGTVEFIVDEDKSFYFMEMNTRLQVEHPVTEKVTGLDLVEWQLRVAAGEPLPMSQDEIHVRGHAIEARIYAENPTNEFLPSTGLVERFAHPAASPSIRTDTGVVSGDEITIHYDPMIAKLISYGPDRSTALRVLRDALSETAVFGPSTNLDLLRRIAAHEEFAAGGIDTGYIDRHLDELIGLVPPPDDVLVAAAARWMHDRETAHRLHVSQASDTTDAASPWSIADGWQANGRSRNRLIFGTADNTRYHVAITGWHERYRVELNDQAHEVEVTAAVGHEFTLNIDSHTHRMTIVRHGHQALVSNGDSSWELAAVDPTEHSKTTSADDKHPGAPMPGRIVAIHVGEGDHVDQGQPLLVLEGMKMEYTLKARVSGSVENIHYQVGDMVDAEVPLVDIAETGSEPGSEPGSESKF